ncbi:MAG: hypothetical protein WC423_14265 [Vulcanimicrobiota bacterium]
MSFEAYFEELRSEGTLDSTGVFTLNIEKLQGKLAAYRLTNPREFVQFLIRAACAAKAESLTSTFTPQQSRISIKKLHFSLEQFQQFSFHSSKSPAEEAAHYLAIALSAADSLGTVRILVGQEGTGFSILSHEGKLSFHHDDPEAAQFDGTVFEVSGLLQEDPADRLLPSARWSEVPFRSRHFELSSKDFYGKVYAAVTGPRFRIPSTCHTARVAFYLSEAEAPDLLLLFWSEHQTVPQSNVHAVHRGITYPLPGITLPVGFHAVVRADDLKPDLSYQGLVEDDAYHAKGKMLRQLVFGLFEKVVAARVDWSENDLRAITQKLDLYWPRSRVSEALRQFYKRNFSLLMPRSQDEVAPLVKRLECLSRSELSECLEPYRARSCEQRAVSPQAAGRLLALESTLRGRLLLVTRDCLHREALFNFLFQNRLPERATLDDLPTVWKVIQLATRRVVGTEERMKELDLHPSWRSLFLFISRIELDDIEAAEQALEKFSQPALEFILRAQGGHASEALRLVEATPGLNRFPAYWKWLLLEFFKGKLSWTLQIQLMAQSRFGQTSEDHALLEASRSRDLFQRLFQTHVFSPSLFWPLSIYYTFNQKKRGTSSLPLWSLLYLQSLLGRPGQSESVSVLQKAPCRLPLCQLI